MGYGMLEGGYPGWVGGIAGPGGGRPELSCGGYGTGYGFEFGG